MNKPLILIVEDDRPVRNLLTLALQQREYRTQTAANGAAALRAAAEVKPDVVVLDVHLPDASGLVSADQRGRQPPFAPDQPVERSVGRFGVGC